MKKLRIIFVTIGVLSVAGGAIAFKEMKFGAGTYCIGTIGGTICPSKLTNTSFLGPGGTPYRKISTNGMCTTTTLCTELGGTLAN